MAQNRAHWWGKWIWILVGGPLTYWWQDSVPWVSFMSLYAIIVSHWGGEVAERAEDAIKHTEETMTHDHSP